MKSSFRKKNAGEIPSPKAVIKQQISYVHAGAAPMYGCFCAMSEVDGQVERKSEEKNVGKKNWKEKFILLASGAVIGMLNGFFGGGGGMVCVPILEKVLKLDNKHAHATAIAVIMPLSLISAFIYVFNGYIQTFPLLVVGGGVVVGGVLGSFILKFLPPKAVRVIFAIIMFAGGIKLIL